MSLGPDTNPTPPHHESPTRADDASGLAELGSIAPLYAHEIHNLITHLSGRAQLALMRPHDQDVTRSVLRTVVEECERASRLSELFLARTGSAPDTDGGDLTKVMHRLEQSFRFDPSASSLLRFPLTHTDLHPAASNIVIEQVLDNLIRNALRAIDEHPSSDDPGHAIAIQVRPINTPSSTWNTPAADQSRPSLIEIVVEDTGVGMSASQIESMLAPANAVRSVRIHNERYPRHGLGMRVCLMLLESVGGQIRCESEPNEGTRMIVTLPAIDHGENESKKAA